MTAPSARLWLAAAQACWLATFAVAVAAIRLELADLGASMRVYPGEEFWDDVSQVKDPGWFLRNFTELQAHRRLSMHGMAHPPGHTLFLWSVVQVFGRSTRAGALAILCVGATSLFPIYFLAMRLFGYRVASRVLILFPVVPCIVMYAVSATDFLFLALASWSFWIAIEALLGGNAAVAFVAGALGGFSAMFSFAEGFVGLITGLFGISLWVNRPGTAVPRQLAYMAAGLLALYVSARWWTGYDWIESLHLTHGFHRYVISSEIGRLTPGMWLYSSFGNLFAFAWYLGIPAVAGFVLSMTDTFRAGFWSGDVGRHFIRSVTYTLALMIFGALFLLEVERIWLYMVSPILAAACSVLPQDQSLHNERRWMVGTAGIMSVQCIIYESLLFTIW